MPGCELSMFCTGFVPGSSLMERVRNTSNPQAWGGYSPDADFAAVLRDVTEVAREHFGGDITYASGDWEEVDWSRFDFAAVDLYRSAGDADRFAQRVRNHRAYGKPLVITEFGCCTYRGAEDEGGMGWAIVDETAAPRTLDGDYVRDESVQVAYFHEWLDVFEASGRTRRFLVHLRLPRGPLRPGPGPRPRHGRLRRRENPQRSEGCPVSRHDVGTEGSLPRHRGPVRPRALTGRCRPGLGGTARPQQGSSRIRQRDVPASRGKFGEAGRGCGPWRRAAVPEVSAWSRPARRRPSSRTT